MRISSDRLWWLPVAMAKAMAVSSASVMEEQRIDALVISRRRDGMALPGTSQSALNWPQLCSFVGTEWLPMGHCPCLAQTSYTVSGNLLVPVANRLGISS